MPVLHILAHVMGLDSQNTAFYMFWSGIATQASVVLAYLSLRAQNKALRQDLKDHHASTKDRSDH